MPQTLKGRDLHALRHTASSTCVTFSKDGSSMADINIRITVVTLAMAKLNRIRDGKSISTGTDCTCPSLSLSCCVIMWLWDMDFAYWDWKMDTNIWKLLCIFYKEQKSNNLYKAQMPPLWGFRKRYSPQQNGTSWSGLAKLPSMTASQKQFFRNLWLSDAAEIDTKRTGCWTWRPCNMQ